jgi:hypothetical protein
MAKTRGIYQPRAHEDAHASNNLMGKQQKQTNHINLGGIYASQEDTFIGYCLDDHQK